MKNIQQRLNSNSKEHSDDTDGSVNYESLKEDLPGEDFNSENTTDTEFYNPVFKPRPVYNSNLGVVENYDTLNFTPRSTPKASPETQRKEKTDADKQIEEIEMMGVKSGVNNYGYMPDRSRPVSWESDLSAINPMSTAIRNPVNIPPRRIPSVGMEMSESPPRDYANSVSKQSAYSSISDNNTYLSSSDKDPQYEVLPRMQQQVLEQRHSGNKKINMLYESAVITEKSEKYRKRSSVDEAASFDDNSNCCHLLFTILTGVLAVVAVVVVFLMVFGVINADCKDCDGSSDSPSTSAQTQSFNRQLQELRNNLTQLKNDLHTNSSDVVNELRKELEVQKNLVTSLTQALEAQKQLTDQLNTTLDKVRSTTLQNSMELFKLKSKTQTHESEINKNDQAITESQKRITNAESSIDYVRKNLENKMTNLNTKVNGIEKEKLSKNDFAVYKNKMEVETGDIIGAVVQLSRNLTNVKNDLKLIDARISNNVSRYLHQLEKKDSQLNHTVERLSQKLSNISLIPGPRGPQGFNGSRGVQGVAGNPARFDTCIFKQKGVTTKVETNHKYKRITASTPYEQGKTIIGVSCSHGNAAYTDLVTVDTTTYDGKPYKMYKCLCESYPSITKDFTCTINYWVC